MTRYFFKCKKCGNEICSSWDEYDDGYLVCSKCKCRYLIDIVESVTNNTTELCPICNKPLHGSGKTLTSREDEKVVHLGCYISHPCDCPHEDDGCHYSGYCEHRKAPDKDLNGTWLPTCGVKFPDRSD